MKTKISLVVLIVFNLCLVYGQTFQDVTAADSEDEINDLCASLSLGFTSTPKAISNVIDEIVNTAGLTEGGFELAQCSNINNVIAKILTDEKGNDVRYIIFDAEWLQSFSEEGSNDWRGKYILAHEIGHHLNGHSLNNGSSNHQYELEADYFAGRALANLGASLDETLAVLEMLPMKATYSHPGRAERAAQGEAGWKSIKNKEYNNRVNAITKTVKQEDVSEIARENLSEINELCKSLSLDDTGGYTSTPKEISKIIDEIVNTAGIANGRFKLAQCSNINNTIAKILIDEEGNEVRYIIYDAEWLQSFSEEGSIDWRGKYILAHEIGHHLNGHRFDNVSSNQKYELEADYFAGRALANLGASLDETLAVMETLPLKATSSHPGRVERAAQADAGWKSISKK